MRDNCSISVQTPVKLLGVTLDQHLTFRTQIDNVVSKCHGLLGTLARATPYLPKQLLKLTYTALIRSHLEYCSSLYSSVAKTHLKKLDIIQKLEMWANAQRVGRPAEYRWRPLFNATKFG